jgi:hypothetical protein
MYHSTPIFWPSIRDPHPSAMKNLRAIAEFLVKGNHTSPETAVTTYYIAETLKKDYGNLSALIRNRPGFVRVENAGGPIKVYYLASIFGSTYPEQYGALRNLPDVPHTMWHSTRETAEAMHKVCSPPTRQCRRLSPRWGQSSTMTRKRLIAPIRLPAFRTISHQPR